jgi:hypothetical protein
MPSPECNATDLGIDLDSIATSDPPIDLDNPLYFHFHDGDTWDWYGCAGLFEPEPRVVYQSNPGRRRHPCPVCLGRPDDGHHYCPRCDATGLDGRRTFPGLGVDEAPDPTYSAEATIYLPLDDGLAGGTGTAPTGRKAKRAARRKAVA